MQIHFLEKKGKSYYFNSIKGFIEDETTSILGKLTKIGAEHGFDSVPEQIRAWEEQIDSLKNKLKVSECSGNIIFEYDIVRMGKRIDVVLLLKNIVFSIEFKNGAEEYYARDAEQAEDYALDIKNFHKESKDLYVCPILVATKAKDKINDISSYDDKQIKLQFANNKNLMDCMRRVFDKYGSSEIIDFEKWYYSSYCPTPTIIEAAVTAYRNNSVKEIANSEAGQEGIDICEKEIFKIIEDTKKNNKKSICFITGVPGAGKTLVGLDVTAKYNDNENNTKSVYLSGNGPLVQVLRKALINNAIDEEKKSRKKLDKEKRKRIESFVGYFIQEAYKFRKECFQNLDKTPIENVVIFDEAQRCWNKEKLSDWSKKKMGVNIDESEPHFFVNVMNKKPEWGVIICLVGLGQDIYDGEVGINEWFNSIISDFPDWDLYFSPKIFNQIEDRNIDKEKIEDYPKSHKIDGIHLSTSIRSFRSEKLSEFVDCLLSNQCDKAKQIYETIKTNYPIKITRDLNQAKKETRKKVRGSQRSGLVACSSAQRLKPEGIFVPTEIDVENWFLAPKEDLRSSNALEIVASEFKIQGLEIDYSIVCWDADLRRNENNNGWDFYNFKGTKWQKRNKEQQKRFLLNAYRVLLTRARQSMIIFVPKGEDPEVDSTRNKNWYDSLFDYLHNKCGIQIL